MPADELSRFKSNFPRKPSKEVKCKFTESVSYKDIQAEHQKAFCDGSPKGGLLSRAGWRSV